MLILFKQKLELANFIKRKSYLNIPPLHILIDQNKIKRFTISYISAISIAGRKKNN